ncbi:hypothetical protein [Acidisoma sp. 7E03]
MSPSFIFKRGTTFVLMLQAQDDASGDPHDLTGSTIASQLRNSLGELVAELTAAPDTQFQTWVRLSFAGDTSAWPLGMLSCDVRVTNPDGTNWATETITIQVVERVTQ